MNQTVNVTRFGFIYHNITFIWRNKSLWRQPFNRDGRYYNEREILYRKVGNSYGCVVDGDFKSKKTLDEIKMLMKVEEDIINECPF